MLLVSVTYRSAIKTLGDEPEVVMLYKRFIDRRVEMRRTGYIVLIHNVIVLFSNELVTHSYSSKPSSLDCIFFNSFRILS